MTNFSHYATGSWKDGQPEKIEMQTYIVRYDSNNWAYTIYKDKYDSFLSWVASNFGDDTWQDEDPDETEEQYFDRIDLSVCEYNQPYPQLAKATMGGIRRDHD